MKNWGILALALLLQPSAGFAANGPMRLKPSSKWIADYQDQGCRLLREFGEGDDKATIVMSRYAPGDSFNLILAGKRFKRSAGGSVELQFGPNEAQQKVDFFAGNLGSIPAMLTTSSMLLAPRPERPDNYDPKNYIAPSPIGAEREKAVTQLQISRPLQTPIVLELGKMDRPMAALNACIDNLVATWGIDVEKHKSLSRWAAPVSNPGNWLTPKDYPVAMLSEGQPALVEFRLDVDPSGGVSGCQIQATTRPKAFDDAVCKALMRRAKFTPALDAQGNPLKSYWKSRVRFQLP
jgi:hypothetical protein